MIRIFWRIVLVVYALALLLLGLLATLSGGSVGDLYLVVVFYWLGMPWSWLLTSFKWTGDGIYVALSIAVVINAGLLWRLGRKRPRATERGAPATVARS